MSTTILAVILLSAVGLIAGIAIFVANRILPKEDESLQKANEVKEFLPGADCGACGLPGCFAYAQAVAKRVQVLEESPCRILAKDEEGSARLGEYLGVDLSNAGPGSRALVHCTGDSPVIAAYSGVTTCAAAVQIAGGEKECPYACVGYGDCADVCPEDAITIDPVNRVAVVDWERCIGCGMCVARCPRALIDVVPAETPQYLGCNYLERKDIVGRKKCSVGCIHCRLCVKASEAGEVVWNDEKDLPRFGAAPAPDAIEKCPRSIILKTNAFPEGVVAAVTPVQASEGAAE
ncbi:4Fe-4S dicluster domain-containing protein [Candidatus Bipolaricaulota bacterium]|nr:4Fe-4S dicluster domain-containing protein [Candidatus Bipolaricaulota bacterium]